MNDFELSINRRTFLGRAAYGIGGIALASLLGRAEAALIRPTHAPVRARRVIHLCMAGGPSHLETFDYKPELKRIDGKAFPESFTKGQQLAQLLVR